MEAHMMPRIRLPSKYLKVPLGSAHQYPCGDCGGKLLLTWGVTWGRLFYRCENFKRGCKGSCTAYPDGTPCGIPVNAEMRMMRHVVHVVFDKLHTDRLCTRTDAYKALGRYFGLDSSAHITEMTTREELEKVLEFCKEVNHGNIIPAEYAVGIRKRDWREP